MTKTKKKWLVPAVAATLAVAIILGIVLYLCFREKTTSEGRFDYLNSDMSRYIELEESQYKGVVAKISRDYEITDETVKEFIDKSLFGIKKLAEDGAGRTDLPIARGDLAYIRYEGSIDGSVFEGGSNASHPSPRAISVGAGEFIDGFEDQLIGIIPSETSKESPKLITVTFPKDYHDSSVAGKTAVFRVWVDYVDKYIIPELTADVIRDSLGYKSETADDMLVEEYRAYVKKNLEVANEASIKNAAIENILEQIGNRANIKRYPKSEIKYWEEHYISQIEASRAQYAQNGQIYASLDEFAPVFLGLESGEDWRAKLEEIYMSNIKSRMVCHAVAQKEGIHLSDDEFEAEINYLISYYAEMNITYTRNDIIEILGTDAIAEEALYIKVCGYLYTMSKIIYED